MKNNQERKKSLIQNLKDTGCDEKIVNEFIFLLNNNQTDKIFILLSNYRKSLLELLHKNQKEIDILDFLINDLRKENI